ncbi:MAG TPA: cysteine hydrolase [Chloroflexota bacterium]|jgi:ureidoacrylate peracid hydrolase
MQLPLAAEPEAITFDPARSAVCVVDMQNHDVEPGGYFALTGVDTTHGERVVEPIQAVLAAARTAGLLVVYTRNALPADRARWPGPDSPAYWKEGLDKHQPEPSLEHGMWIDGNWGAEIIDELRPHPGEVVITKGTYSGFVRTDLDLQLRRRGIRYLFMTGIGTPTCVEATARDAYFHDYWPILLADCCGAILPQTHEQALFAIKRRYGWVTTSDALRSALQQSVPAPAAAGAS